MRVFALCAPLLLSTLAFAGPVGLEDTAPHRSASLLEGLELDATYRPSASPPLRLGDGLKFSLMETPAPLDQGGGVDAELRRVLALILGIIPGFGLGHLIARDRDGFVLFLIVDIVLYALAITVGSVFHGVFWGLGGLVWLVVHIFQGLDAYAEAGGERFLMDLRDRGVRIARAGEPAGLHPSRVTTRVFGFSF